ncbi:protein PRRC1-A [Tribolium castaneum]|uniref:Protein PRRC1-A-like Protein n=1 Tax=Tribolium castaneum TaxID=7070 RepID=D6WRQ9_TRICA|nr:PREDICTED: protein PRRC1-A [Tribolium castaneum]EFA07067.2 Protein PRRC1-A-like Protein [Tribolium castaneum]|eukprot:XP_975633.1 PREDICTED: protein PRRC1-A [Tribolium castaneum]
MLQEDSNGEASFEIIDKKQDDASNDKTESLSSVSSPYSIPSPGGVALPGGNLLSNLPPPTNLPDFTLWQSQAIPAPTPLPPNIAPAATQAAPAPVNVQPFPQTQFSAAIPPSKGVQHGPVPQTSADAGQGGGGLIGWMKDAVSSGGILSKVAEKAKNSVDSLITTLDPQMSEFIYSGGDVELAVVSQDPDEVAPIREAIFSVFGKAWVNGISVKVDERKHQAVGFEEGIKRAEEKLKAALNSSQVPTIAIENILLQQNDEWFDLSVLVLKDVEKKILLKTYTQTTPIPLDSFVKLAEKEMPSYAKGCDSTEKLLAAYLQVCKNNWQQGVSGVARKETLFLAARTLVTLYKNKITN